MTESLAHLAHQPWLLAAAAALIVALCVDWISVELDVQVDQPTGSGFDPGPHGEADVLRAEVFDDALLRVELP